MATTLRLARAVTRHPIMSMRAGPSTLFARSLQTSTRRLGAAAQLAESEDRPSYYETPHPSFDQHDTSSSKVEAEYPTRTSPLIHMPQPLPADVMNAADYATGTMYPAAGVLDSISMIAICLRRPEHIPRAFQIFQQILLSAKGSPHRLPEAEVWARVIEGVASLGEMKQGDEAWKTWRGRAEALVGKWEANNNVPRGYPALQHDGLKVYQGWLSGLLK